MARLCGRIIEATGWTFRDLDGLSVDEMRQLVAYWRESPPLADCVRAYLGIQPGEIEQDDGDEHDAEPQRDLTEEEWQQKREGLKTYAAKHGGPRNPFVGAMRG